MKAKFLINNFVSEMHVPDDPNPIMYLIIGEQKHEFYLDNVYLELKPNGNRWEKERVAYYYVRGPTA